MELGGRGFASQEIMEEIASASDLSARVRLRLSVNYRHAARCRWRSACELSLMRTAHGPHHTPHYLSLTSRRSSLSTPASTAASAPTPPRSTPAACCPGPRCSACAAQRSAAQRSAASRRALGPARPWAPPARSQAAGPGRCGPPTPRWTTHMPTPPSHTPNRRFGSSKRSLRCLRSCPTTSEPLLPAGPWDDAATPAERPPRASPRPLAFPPLKKQHYHLQTAGSAGGAGGRAPHCAALLPTL